MEIGGWLGLAEPRPIDALALAFFSDALIPAPFMRLGRAGGGADDRPDGPLPRGAAAAPRRRAQASCASRASRTRLIHEGFFEEDGVIWAADGTLLAQSRQLAILMPIAIGLGSPRMADYTAKQHQGHGGRLRRRVREGPRRARGDARSACR